MDTSSLSPATAVTRKPSSGPFMMTAAHIAETWLVPPAVVPDTVCDAPRAMSPGSPQVSARIASGGDSLASIVPEPASCGPTQGPATHDSPDGQTPSLHL